MYIRSYGSHWLESRYAELKLAGPLLQVAREDSSTTEEFIYQATRFFLQTTITILKVLPSEIISLERGGIISNKQWHYTTLPVNHPTSPTSLNLPIHLFWNPSQTALIIEPEQQSWKSLP